jgi:hypothetical protein
LAPLPLLAVADENDDDDDKDGRGRCCWSCTSDAPKTSNGLELPPWPDEEPPRDNDDEEDDDDDAATGGAEEAKGSNMLNGLPLADMIGMTMVGCYRRLRRIEVGGRLRCVCFRHAIFGSGVFSPAAGVPRFFCLLKVPKVCPSFNRPSTP